MVEQEWQTPSSNLNDPEADAAYRRLLGFIADSDAWLGMRPSMQRMLLDAAQQISNGRLVCLSAHRKEIDEISWIGVLVLGLFAQRAVAAVHLERRRGQGLALALCIAAIVTALSVVALAESPFDGITSLSSRPLASLLDEARP